MKKHTLQSTNNYSLFLSHENQQAISPSHVKRLAVSMGKHGYFPSEPVEVWRDEKGKLHIIDGHHRVLAAQQVGCFIYFVVVDKEDAELIGEKNLFVRKWANESFIKLYASRGDKNYQMILDYSHKGLPIPVATAILAGQIGMSAGGRLGDQLRLGNYKIKDTALADKLVETLEELEDVTPEIQCATYLGALALMLQLKEFHLKTFIAKAKNNSLAVVKCANRDQALKVLEDVMNYRSAIRPNLAYMAKEAARQRTLHAFDPKKALKKQAALALQRTD